MNYDENKRMTLEEVKKVELQLLITFHDFCEKHKLKYVLDSNVSNRICEVVGDFYAQKDCAMI